MTEPTGLQGALFDAPEGWCPSERCSVCGGALRQPRGDTYVVQRQGWVKVGRSKHVGVRVRELAAPNRQRYIWCPPAMDRAEPLLLVGVIRGDVEHELHVRWAADHVGGEWFLPGGLMRGWLARLGSDSGSCVRV